MLPVALTCPVWWVARWTARMLTSLAVAVAFSLGATALPVEAAASSWAAPTGDILSSAADDWSDPTLPTRWLRPTPTVADDWSGPALPTRWSRPTPTADSGHAATATAGSGRTDIPTAGSHLAGVGDVPAPVAVPRPASAAVVPATPQHVTGGRAPSALGSRAPPTR